MAKFILGTPDRNNYIAAFICFNDETKKLERYIFLLDCTDKDKKAVQDAENLIYPSEEKRAEILLYMADKVSTLYKHTKWLEKGDKVIKSNKRARTVPADTELIITGFSSFDYYGKVTNYIHCKDEENNEYKTNMNNVKSITKYSNTVKEEEVWSLLCDSDNELFYKFND